MTMIALYATPYHLDRQIHSGLSRSLDCAREAALDFDTTQHVDIRPTLWLCCGITLSLSSSPASSNTWCRLLRPVEIPELKCLRLDNGDGHDADSVQQWRKAPGTQKVHLHAYYFPPPDFLIFRFLPIRPPKLCPRDLSLAGVASAVFSFLSPSSRRDFLFGRGDFPASASSSPRFSLTLPAPLPPRFRSLLFESAFSSSSPSACSLDQYCSRIEGLCAHLPLAGTLSTITIASRFTGPLGHLF